ncbi:MAG: hypothetical protein DSO08_00475 [Candidatus Methanomethylicota archaeon]|uniref:4Fe-4S ferredoxin-type domain-containing protein n=1 Tax=Thermoproteota archaeon TaxID=2056631 RepID=A0A523BGU1_9CREN|nr:MAG: hypothetical protein DSO08_00475 [Candidatus Verstraetearchaeota archaeon]
MRPKKQRGCNGGGAEIPGSCGGHIQEVVRTGVPENGQEEGEKIIPCIVLEEKCIGCRTCVAAFGCPAMGFDTVKKKSYINTLDCTGCKVCIAVCPYGAIKQSEE